MKWDRAVHHLDTLARSCADMATRPASIFPLRVRQLWAVGDILGPPGDLETVTVAMGVDLPAEDVAWWTEPPGAQHWANAIRLPQSPVRVWWRSVHAPIWNHRIERPALIWDDDGGVRQDSLDALRDGRAETVRDGAPTAEKLAERLDDELATSLRALDGCTDAYGQRRWSPGKLEPLADALWRASDGYLDVLSAVRS